MSLGVVMSSSIHAVNAGKQEIAPGVQVGVYVLVGVGAYTLYRQGFRFYAGLREIYFLM
jgi:hypothetical protein